MGEKLNILFAPIHYVLDAHNSGSEFAWSFNIYELISKEKSIAPTFLTGGTRGVTDKNVIDMKMFDTNKINLAIHNVMLFYIKTFMAAVKIKKIEDIDIIHHVLPFHIGHSFNILPFIYRKKFIIGPLQQPLSVLDSDHDRSNARGANARSFSLTTLIETTGLAVIKPIISFFSHQTLKRADMIICVNDEVQRNLINMGINKNKTTIIPPGIRTEKFSHTIDRSDTKILHIISSCYLLKRKRVDLIIKAFQNAYRKNQNLHLHIVGDGPQKQNLEKLVKNLHLEKHISFYGHVPHAQMTQYYKKASVFVHMSQSESFGAVCLEAMTSELVVIATKVGVFETVVKNGENGYLVDVDDYKALADSIVYLSHHKDKLRKLGLQARHDIETTYDWKNVVINQYLNLYKTLQS